MAIYKQYIKVLFIDATCSSIIYSLINFPCFSRRTVTHTEEEEEWVPENRTLDSTDDEGSVKKKPKHGTRKQKRDTEKEKLRLKKYRAEMTDEKRERCRELARKRMKKLRQKRKEDGIVVERSGSEMLKLREQWRMEKRKQRLKHGKRTPELKAKEATKKLQRQIDKLSPIAFAYVIKNTTPRKLRFLKKTGITSSPNTKRKTRMARKTVWKLKQQMSSLRNVKNKKSRDKLRILASVCAQNYVLNSRTFKKYTQMSTEDELQRKTRCDSLPDSLKKEIEEFYKDMSRALPDKRRAGKSVLTDTLKHLHKEYAGSRKKKVCLSTFTRLKPKQILTVDHTAFQGCLCEYCLNADYAVSILTIL